MWRRVAVGLCLACVVGAVAVFFATRGSSSTSASAVCKQLVALHENDLRPDPTNPVAALPTDHPTEAAAKWAAYLSKQVPKIGDKALHAFAYDYAWTAENADAGTALPVLGGPFVTPAAQKDTQKLVQVRVNRETMATYYAHEFCYADTENDAL
jgi:hypothetical protein